MFAGYHPAKELATRRTEATHSQNGATGTKLARESPRRGGRTRRVATPDTGAAWTLTNSATLRPNLGAGVGVARPMASRRLVASW